MLGGLTRVEVAFESRRDLQQGEYAKYKIF